MSTSYGWEGIRQVCATLLGARHVPERLCGASVYLERYNKCSTFTFFTLRCPTVCPMRYKKNPVRFFPYRGWRGGGKKTTADDDLAWTFLNLQTRLYAAGKWLTFY